MKIVTIGLVGAVVAIAACSDDYAPNESAVTGTDTGDPSASGPGTDGPGTSGPATGGPSTSGPATNPGTSGPATAAPTGTAVDLVGEEECTNVTGCGGNVVGTWNVASSCLEISGDLDVFLTSLACPSVPATGQLQTTGSITFNADGSYTDETTTTGSVTFPLAANCLAISGVPVMCDRVGSIFAAVGWKTAECLPEGDGCDCSLSTEQEGGLGFILPYTEPEGQYSTSGSELTAANATYDYCAEGNTLTLSSGMSALSGTVVLQKEGTVPTPGTGGASGMAGMGSTGEGGMMSGQGGAMSGEGGMMSGEGGTSGGGMSGGGMMSGGMGGTPGAGGSPGVVSERPCDIYEAAGNPCVAAHSTVRALFGAFDGALYQVKRGDGMTQDIPVNAAGFADSAVQDSFCQGTSCTIWRVYDQTGNENFLEAQTPDSTVGGFQNQTAANATAESITVGGHQVYSLFTRPSQAYWNDGSQTGMPIGAEPQGIYMVTSGEHFNGGCCYNYGNAQLDRNYSGGPMMDAVYFGNNTIWGTGEGNGPWVMADMEDGMLSGGTPGAQNPNNLSLPFPFVTAMEKNDGTMNFALKGGDATGPTLTTMWEGALPSSKRPMEKQGAVILGAGGDCCYSNNNASEGTFYEGAIVEGYPSGDTDEAIHANIVEAGYGQ